VNNPGLDPPTWERLKKQWSDLQSAGHKLKVEFRLLADPRDEKNILAIDVVQNVNSGVLTETVQKNAGEAHAALGIAGLSMEALVAAYKTIMSDLYNQSGQKELDLVVTMTRTSTTSGEVQGYLTKENSDVRNSVFVNYRHYYVLNALRDQMIGLVGDGWKRVRAVYRPGDLEFYFEY
jgi:hypothetical protein